MKKRSKKIRALGKITTELEPLYFEMLDEHKMQPHEIIGLFLSWQQAHYPSATEYYSVDGSLPVWYYYGHKDGLKKRIEDRWGDDDVPWGE